MEATKPVVQVILPRAHHVDDQQELSRPPSAFPVGEIERLRGQEGGDEVQNESSDPTKSTTEASQDSIPAPPEYSDPIPYHPKPSLDLPPYEPLPDTFTPALQKEKPEQKPNIGLSLAGSASGLASNSDEKKRLDLEAVTSAVDHAYTAAPQFDDQRSELRPSTSVSGSRSAGLVPEGSALGRKMSVKDEKELNKLFDQIERAHGNKLPDQSTELDLDRVAERTTKKRESFYNSLLSSASAGRMHDQEYDLANASPRVSPLVKSFAESGTRAGVDDESEEEEEGRGKRKSREVVDIHQAIRDGPGQL